ncbi:hypothetical protein GCM10022228_11410 [Halomonas cibimaris]|uniref:Uncharacterized protein n=1 Tax=Halomonas cibimaris TaxID=657012 RepID=A0ABP7LIU2_9GAMM
MGLVLLAILLAVGLGHNGMRQSDNDAVRFIIHGEPMVLDATEQADLQGVLGQRLGELESTLQSSTQEWQDAELEKLEADYHAAVDGYLDWYFSATATYTRLGIALTGDLDEWMHEQLEERLVRKVALEASLTEMSRQHHAIVTNAEQQWQQNTLVGLQERYAPESSGALEGVSTEDDAMPTTVNLDQIIQRKQSQPDISAALQPHSASVVPASIATGFTAKRLVAGKAMQRVRQQLIKFAARVGIQVTRSSAAGAGTSFVGTPIVGIVVTTVGIAATVGTEYIALQRAEAKHRPAMEAELHDSWGNLEAQIRQAFQAQEQARAKALRERLEQQAEEARKQSGLPDTYRILG